MTGTDAAQNKKIWSDRRIVSPLTGGALLRVFRSSVSPELGIFSRHHHTAFEITMVIEGSGVYSTKNGAFRFGSGDIFYFSTDEFHWITELECETNFLNVHLSRVLSGRKNSEYQILILCASFSAAAAACRPSFPQMRGERRLSAVFCIKLKRNLLIACRSMKRW